MLRTFHGVEKVFDGEWHKVALSVKGRQVKLLIDCEEVRVESIDEPRPIIRRGHTSIVKRAARDRSVSVCSHLTFLMTLNNLSFDFFYNFISSYFLLFLSRWTYSRWKCHVMQRRLIRKAAVSSRAWWVIHLTALLCVAVWVEFQNHWATCLPIAVWRVCRDRPHGGETILQMHARTAGRPGPSGTKGEYTCTWNWLKIQQVECFMTYFFLLLQGHRGLPGEAGDRGRQGNWVKKKKNATFLSLMQISNLTGWMHAAVYTPCIPSRSRSYLPLPRNKELSWLVGEEDCKTFIRETAGKLWKMAIEAQLRNDRMETDLEAEALSDSKHGVSTRSLKSHVRFAKDSGRIQDKHEPTWLRQ